ncbi:TDP-N-acetylfucosamine:lipid II N-acetylfucosaminyltransferase [Nonlabens sp. YIK11]|uniref:TDP-N-acetylfucosamine:lipid II N-acetylfucosaminyltransferase n=1 Tax=Nonlabens sp. YIK11 TaxID=1453349 RepID=UPI0006DCADAD|nr:TDP-N-acetylfucosamine:lipid II N-acetylfucosaminyltransferase [Nonlabens sp. YIK11]
MKRFKLLHVIDDPKFIGMCKTTFEIDICENLFTTSRDWNPKDISVDFIFIHYLSAISIKKILGHHFEKPLIWFFWGGDAFNLGKFYNEFLTNNAIKLRRNLAWKRSISEGFNVTVKTELPFVIDKFLYGKETLKAIQSFDKIVPIMPGDSSLLLSYYDLTVNSFHLNYVNPTLDRPPSFTHGVNILLGNSASYTNNHMEIIDFLAAMDLSNRQVIIPLNYGDMDYALAVQSYAENKLGDIAYPLMDFLPFNEYQDLLASCSVVIMNHKRQQALGNIIQALYSGSKIVLRSESTVFKYLLENGFVIEDMDQLNLKSLDHEDQIHNSNLCQSVFGKKRQHDRVRELLKELLR